MRKKVTEAKLFAKGHHPQFRWSRRWNSMKITEITNWASSDIKTIYITQDVGDLSYPLCVRQFIPQDGDSLERRWKTRGMDRSYQCTSYAIKNMKEPSENLLVFIDDSIESFINHYIDKSDPLLYKTYLMALQCSDQLDVSNSYSQIQT
jgi:hypothetical protein